VEEIHRAISARIDPELRRGPLVLQLEDVHWADLGSVRAIDYLLSAHAQQPLLVLATARPEVRELYPDLWHRRSLREIRLGELTDLDVHRLISLRLGDDLGEEARTRIVQRARGNAFLLRELIRAQAEGQGGETPETALGVVQSRLRAFHSDARRVLRAASVLGESFTSAALAFLLGDASNPGDVERWLDLLSAREVVRRRDDGPGGKAMFVFSHAVVRDAAYDMLTESDRKLGHRLAAEWLEGPGRGEPAVLAQHYELAGERTAAGRCYARATFEALAIGDFATTLASAERALTFDLLQPDRGHLLACAAHAHRLTGDVEASRRLSAEALRLLPPNTPLWWQAARTAMMAGASTASHGSNLSR
jgi:predicted ATPase